MWCSASSLSFFSCGCSFPKNHLPNHHHLPSICEHTSNINKNTCRSTSKSSKQTHPNKTRHNSSVNPTIQSHPTTRRALRICALSRSKGTSWSVSSCCTRCASFSFCRKVYLGGATWLLVVGQLIVGWTKRTLERNQSKSIKFGEVLLICIFWGNFLDGLCRTQGLWADTLW